LDESQDIRSGEMERLDVRHFANRLPATLNYESLAAIANAVKKFEKATALLLFPSLYMSLII
jgi:hypothetical protein